MKKTNGVETKKRYKEISSYLSDVAEDLKNHINEDMSVDEFVEYELEAQKKLYEKYLNNNNLNFKFPSVEQAVTTARFGSYTDTSTFENYLNSLESQFFNVWDSNVREGYLLGTPTKKIVSKVVGTQAGNLKLAEAGAMHQFRNSVMANTRTALQAMANDTRKLVMERNAELFDGYEWVSTLDRRSCLVCGSLDGKVEKNIRDFGEQPPIHYNCRCLIIPKISGYDELDKGDTRASENGEVASDMSYESWLKSQPAEVQRDVLGEARYNIFQQTGKIGDFVNNGKVIPLDKLIDGRNIDVRGMANGNRRSIFIDITDEEKKRILDIAKDLQIKESELLFIKDMQTCYIDELDKVNIGSDVFPSNDGSINNRDNMTEKAVLAHEYYGHKQFRNTKLPKGDIRDEFRASFYASIHAPSLSDIERQSLMRDALERAREGGINIRITPIIRKILYGYD